jgi:tight adherence protein C
MAVYVVVIVLTFFVLFGLILVVLGARPTASERLMAVTSEAQTESAPATGWLQGLDLERMAAGMAPLRKLFGLSSSPEVAQRLAMAGYRKASHVDVFNAARMLLPVVAAVTAAFLAKQAVIFWVVVSAVVGFLVPDFWLTRAISKRKEHIRLSLPDALDLLVICLEAGLGLDQALLRVGQELKITHKELAEEFLVINLEQRAGVPRIQAWRNMAQRSGVESVRTFVHMLAQTERFGTPVAKSLGAYADALRVRRRQQAEEMAAKTTVKLVPPLVLFIFPSLFIVLLAPAVIVIEKNLGKAVE